MATADERYFDLLKRSINQYLYLGGDESLDDYFVDAEPRYAGHEWTVPATCRPLTVSHRRQLDFLHDRIVEVHNNGVAGDFMEAGVWRGGVIVLMLACVEVHQMRRNVVAADSFAGIPRSKSVSDDPVDAWSDRWEASREEVLATISRYGLLSDRLRLIAGPFDETLPSPEVERLALLRIDVDSYESTKLALEALYPALETGGTVIIDDWHLPGCATAVLEFRLAHGIKAPVIEEAMNIYWTKAVPQGSQAGSPMAAETPESGVPPSIDGPLKLG